MRAVIIFRKDLRWGRHLGCYWPIQNQWGGRPQRKHLMGSSQIQLSAGHKNLGSKRDAICLHHIGICNLTAWSWIFWSKASWSRVPSCVMGISAAGITMGSLKRRNSPSSKVMPFTSIWSPAAVAAWASRPDWNVRPAIMQATQTSWSRPHSGHIGNGSSGEGQASQNPVVGLPQATHGCWRDRAGSGSGRIDHANAAHASRSQSRRPRGRLCGSLLGLARCHSKERRKRALQSAATTDGMAANDATRFEIPLQRENNSHPLRDLFEPRGLLTPPFCTHLSKRN